jgi:hypothetical protein
MRGLSAVNHHQRIVEVLLDALGIVAPDSWAAAGDRER